MIPVRLVRYNFRISAFNFQLNKISANRHAKQRRAVFTQFFCAEIKHHQYQKEDNDGFVATDRTVYRVCSTYI